MKGLLVLVASLIGILFTQCSQGGWWPNEAKSCIQTISISNKFKFTKITFSYLQIFPLPLTVFVALFFKNTFQQNNTIIRCPGLQCWECGLGGGTCHNSSDTGQLVTCGDGETSCFKSETSQLAADVSKQPSLCGLVHFYKIYQEMIPQVPVSRWWCGSVGQWRAPSVWSPPSPATRSSSQPG